MKGLSIGRYDETFASEDGWFRKFVFESVREGHATEAGPRTKSFSSIQLR